MRPNHFFRTALVLGLLLVGLLAAGVFPATAADNTATGDIAGAGAALTDSNTVSLTATASAQGSSQLPKLPSLVMSNEPASEQSLLSTPPQDQASHPT